VSRDIDRIIEYVRNLDRWFIPPVHRQVIINRIEGDGPPTDEELARAKAQVDAE
jgi:hypothetical protein